jgi:hypothetical protein
LEQERLQFELSDFVVGNISELATRTYSDLVTKLGEGDEIHISMREDNVGENGIDTSEFNANASWTTGRGSSENWDIPAKVVFETMENPEWYSRYANFRVTVTYQGRSRTYKALFLIGNYGSEQKVIALDNVTNNSSLTFFAQASVHPNTLLKTRLHSNRAVAEWLRSQANSESSCQIQKGETCCDAATMKCGLAKDEVDAQIGIPISTLVPLPIGLTGCRRIGDWPTLSVHLFEVSN